MLMRSINNVAEAQKYTLIAQLIKGVRSRRESGGVACELMRRWGEGGGAADGDAARYLLSKWGLSFPSSGREPPPPSSSEPLSFTRRQQGVCRISIITIIICAGCNPEELLLLHRPHTARGAGDASTVPCAERHVCVNSHGDRGKGQWSSCHQIPADAPWVKHWRLWCRETKKKKKPFIRSNQLQTFVLIARRKNKKGGLSGLVWLFIPTSTMG